MARIGFIALICLLAYVVASFGLAAPPAKSGPTTAAPSSNPFMANLDRMLSGPVQTPMKLNNMLEGDLASNLSSTLNDMASNLRKMLAENKKLQSQMQEVVQRVQNVTGINATNIQQQANMANISSLTNMTNALVSRFQVPKQ